MPTGVALRDAREHLLDAAERVLLRAGPSGLTSRSVTTEAGCAKGVLHRHFTDFDGFLAALVQERAARVTRQAEALRARAGSGSVIDTLAAALVELFDPVAVAVVALVTSRDGLRARLREAGLPGIPVMAEATALVAGYLTAERALGRIPADADTDTLAPTLIGAGHLLYADRSSPPPTERDVHRMVRTVLAGVA